MLKRHSGFTIIETLIAFLILMFVISITVLASSWIVGLEKKAMVKSDIYDVAYSYAEECLSKSISDLENSTLTLNGFTYYCSFATHTNASISDYFGKADVHTATLTTELNDEKITDEVYEVKMLIIPIPKKP